MVINKMLEISAVNEIMEELPCGKDQMISTKASLPDEYSVVADRLDGNDALVDRLDENDAPVDKLNTVSNGHPKQSEEDALKTVCGKNLMVNIAPEELFCREKEVSLLQGTYMMVNQQSRIVIIRGETGTGKTALARSLQKDCTYFLEGKFDQRPQPNSALISAFRQLCKKLLPTEIDKLKLSIESLLLEPSYKKVLADIIPELKCILENEPKHIIPVHTTKCNGGDFNFRSESANINRLKSSFHCLLRSFILCSPNNRLVLFLDDIHWYSKSDLDFLFSLIKDFDVPGILFVLSYSDPEDEGGNKQIMQLLERCKKSEIREITIANLNEVQVSELLSKKLQVSSDYSKILAETIWEQTKGNVYFTLEYVRVLQKNGFIRCTVEGGWFWSDEEIQIGYSSLSNLIHSQIEKMSLEAQECLATISCLGTQIDNDVIHHLGFGPSVPSFCEIMDQGWIALDQNRMAWNFAHNKIQETTYRLIPEHDKIGYHYRIGRKLWREMDMDELLSYIFIVVGQLVMAQNHLKDPKECTAVAKLCLEAGEQAARLSSFHAAQSYFNNGIALLDTRAWRDEYDLCLSLYGGAAECSYSSGNVDAVHDFVYEILKNARDFEDTIRVQLINIVAIGSSGQIKKATCTGIELLKQLGEEFPLRPNKFHGLYEIIRLRLRLIGKNHKTILGLPVMHDQTKQFAMQTLNLVLIYVCETNLDLAALVSLRMMSITLDYGISDLSCMGFVMFASGLCALGFIDEGYRFGQLGFALQEKFQNRSFVPRFFGFYYESIHCWKRPALECVEPLQYARRVGQETGDVEFSMMCALVSILCSFDKRHLKESEQEMRVLSEQTSTMKQDHVFVLIQPMWQSFHNLMGLASGDPAVLTGQVVNEAEIEKLKAVSLLVHSMSSFPRLLVRYLFQNFSDDSMEIMRIARKVARTNISPCFTGLVHLFSGLFCVATARKSNRRWTPYANKCSKRLRQMAEHEPYNYLGKYLLLEAEISGLVRHSRRSTFSKYVSAVAMTKESGSLMEYAIANESTAKFLIRQKDKHRAEKYVREAILTYVQWGATGKADHLRDEMGVHGYIPA